MFLRCSHFAVLPFLAFMVLSTGTMRADELPLTNEDVLALSRAGLGDEVVLSKIRQAPRETLDVSTEALLSFKKAGLPRPVIDAMIKRVGERARPPESTPALLAPSAPTPTPTALPTARLRAAFDNNVSECFYFFDYPEPLNNLKARWTIMGRYGPLVSDWKNELVQEPTGEITKPWSRESGAVVSEYRDVPSGRHRISVYCDPWWHVNNVVGDLEPGGRYTLRLHVGNTATAGLSIRGLQRD